MEKMQAQPKVSVCIPTYNYADYLPFAIESVLHQSFTDFELIIQDDCSSDNTAEVVERYLSDRRLIFETNERNLALAGNWNLCLSKARGQYIKFIFADDLLASPDCLAKMVSVLDRDRSVSLVSSARNIIDSQSRLVHVLSDFGRGSFTADGHKIISYCLLRLTNFIGEPSGVMFRRADSGRGFSPRYAHALDVEFWFHLLESGRFVFIDETLTSYRVHPRQKTNENVANLIALHDNVLLLQDYVWRPNILGWRAVKHYIIIDAVYQFWRLAKKGKIDRKRAMDGIGACFPVRRFFLAYPLYKLIKPFFRLFLKVTDWPYRKLSPSFLPLMERESVLPDLNGNKGLRPRNK